MAGDGLAARHPPVGFVFRACGDGFKGMLHEILTSSVLLLLPFVNAGPPKGGEQRIESRSRPVWKG